MALLKQFLSQAMNLQETQKSSLASTIGSPTLGPTYRKVFEEWKSRKLTSGFSAQWHSEFWGKAMADDEQDWRNTQSPIASTERIGGDSDRMDEFEGKGSDDSPQEDHAANQDADSEDDDIIPGCYMLNMSSVGRFWIRADYIRIFDGIEEFFNSKTPPFRPPSVVVAGQPDTGKSIWIYYAIRRYLAEKKPFIWYGKGFCHLFADEGVFEAPSDYDPTYFKVFVRTLVDADESDATPGFLAGSVAIRRALIYVTHPQRKERWRRLYKTTVTMRFIMNPWKRKEIVRVAQIFNPEIEEEAINNIIFRFGPNPRLCIEGFTNPEVLEHHAREVERVVSNLNIEQLDGMFKAARDLAMDSASNKILLMTRAEDFRFGASVIVTPISRFVHLQLATRFGERLSELIRKSNPLNFKVFRIFQHLGWDRAGQM